MSQEAIRTLEQVRQRLNTLAAQLSSLRRDLESHEMLPSWTSIQNSANLLSHNLASIHGTMSSAQHLLTAAHAYPLPSYPGRTQEHSLTMLMRKKLQPAVEDWIDDGAKRGTELEGNGAAPQMNGHTALRKESLPQQDLDDLWSWAGPEGNRIAREVFTDSFADVYTLAEIEQGVENIETGLSRKFFDSDDEEDGEGDGEGKGHEKGETMDLDVQDVRPETLKRLDRSGVDPKKSISPLETMLRFANAGSMPPGSSISMP